MFTLSTHHAYLNTRVTIKRSVSEEFMHQISILDQDTGNRIIVKDKDVSLHFSKGIHRLIATDPDGMYRSHQETIIIEDAIKLGGSTIKGGYISDETNVRFIVMHDRMYWYSRITPMQQMDYAMEIDIYTPDTFEIDYDASYHEAVEFGISPNYIEHLYGRFYLFKLDDGTFGVFDTLCQNCVVSFSLLIYKCQDSIVYEQERSIYFFSTELGKVLYQIDADNYSLENGKLYFFDNHKLLSTDLHDPLLFSQTLTINKEHLREGFLYRHYLLTGGKKTGAYFIYTIYDLEEEKRYVIETPNKIVAFGQHCIVNVANYIDIYQQLLKDNRETISELGIELDFSLLYIIDIVSQNNCPVIKYKKTDIRHFGQKDKFYQAAIDSHFLTSHSEEISECTYKNQLPLIIEDNIFIKDNQIAISESGNKSIEIRNGQIIDIDEGLERVVLQELYDNSFYKSAFLTSDGKSIVIRGADDSLEVFGFGDLSKKPFPVENFNITISPCINGYIPEIELRTGREPVWRSPFTLQWIGENPLCKFVSPNGRYIANNNFKIVLWNVIDNKECSLVEASKYKTLYNWAINAKDEEKRQIKKRRKELILRYRNILSAPIYREAELIYGQNNTNKQVEIEQYVEFSLNEWCEKSHEFTSLFLYRNGYVVYRDEETKTTHQIIIGRSVWHLNYISFSADSRYMAIGAKLSSKIRHNGDPFRQDEPGVFILYDLKEKLEKKRIDENSNLDAVWMTIFDQKGNVAFYDSSPKVVVYMADKNYSENQIAYNYSLLGISPSGNYIIMSNQNYKSMPCQKGIGYGHQKSGDIYISRMNNISNVLFHCNDFHGGILHNYNDQDFVASAVMSSDDRRLLAVGEDGIIVVRNLHL